MTGRQTPITPGSSTLLVACIRTPAGNVMWSKAIGVLARSARRIWRHIVKRTRRTETAPHTHMARMTTRIQLEAALASDGIAAVGNPTSRNGWPICVITDENAGDVGGV